MAKWFDIANLDANDEGTLARLIGKIRLLTDLNDVQKVAVQRALESLTIILKSYHHYHRPSGIGRGKAQVKIYKIDDEVVSDAKSNLASLAAAGITGLPGEDLAAIEVILEKLR